MGYKEKFIKMLVLEIKDKKELSFKVRPKFSLQD